MTHFHLWFDLYRVVCTTAVSAAGLAQSGLRRRRTVWSLVVVWVAASVYSLSVVILKLSLPSTWRRYDDGRSSNYDNELHTDDDVNNNNNNNNSRFYYPVFVFFKVCLPFTISFALPLPNNVPVKRARNDEGISGRAIGTVQLSVGSCPFLVNHDDSDQVRPKESGQPG